MDTGHLHNPADLPLVTFDNNALIALRKEEIDAPAVRKLLELNRDQAININVTMSTGMEAPHPSDRLEWQDKIAWLESLGIVRENIFTSWRSVGFNVPEYPGVPVFDPMLEIQFARKIHAIFHPEIPFLWRDYRDRECKKRDLTEVQKQALLEIEAMQSGITRIPPRPTPALDRFSDNELVELHKLYQRLHNRWANAKNDALGLHAHITSAWHTKHPERAVFVTSDKGLRKPARLAALRASGYRGQVLPPGEAVAFLLSVPRTALCS